MKRSCVDDETIIDYLEGRLQTRSRERMEKHLCNCSGCRELLMVAADLMHGDQDNQLYAAPPALTKRVAKAAVDVSKSPNNWKRHIRKGGKKLIHNARSLVEKAAPYAPPQPVLLRSGPMPPGDDFTRYPIKFAGIEGVLEIEKISDDAFTVQVEIIMENPLDKPIRASLFTGDHEIASVTLLDEAVQFEDIPGGQYVIKFSRTHQMFDAYYFEI